MDTIGCKVCGTRGDVDYYTQDDEIITEPCSSCKGTGQTIVGALLTESPEIPKTAMIAARIAIHRFIEKEKMGRLK